MTNVFLPLVLFTSLVLLACAKPNAVRVFNSPTNGVFYTVETYYGHGPSSDTTRVYASLGHGGEKMLVLEGENLTVTKVMWEGQHAATLCLDGGITGTFRNEVTLISGTASETIHNRLQEHCSTP
jgi:hypothetical protein